MVDVAFEKTQSIISQEALAEKITGINEEILEFSSRDMSFGKSC